MSLKTAGIRGIGPRLGLMAALYCPTVFAQPSEPAPSPSAGPATTKNQANAADLAQQRFREATEAYQNERYSAAASLFEAADRLAPHASNRFNAATAWEQAGELARAATGYQAALAQADVDGELGEQRRRTANERLNTLRSSLAPVGVQEPLGAFVTVDHVQRLALPARFYLQPGSYRFDLEFKGKTHRKTEQVGPGKLTVIDFGLRPPTAVPPPAPAMLPAAPDTVTTLGPSTWTWVAFGAGLILSGVATNFGLDALNAQETYKNDLTRENETEAKRLQRYTNIAWGGAATAGVAGVILLWTAPQIEF